MRAAELSQPVVIGAQHSPFELGVIDAVKAQTKGGVHHLAPDRVAIYLFEPGIRVLGRRWDVFFPAPRLANFAVAADHACRRADRRHLDVLAAQLAADFPLNKPRPTVPKLPRPPLPQRDTGLAQLGTRRKEILCPF